MRRPQVNAFQGWNRSTVPPLSLTLSPAAGARGQNKTHNVIWLCAFALLFRLSLLSTSAACAQEDDDELAPGLLASYTSGDTVVRRVDADLAWDWKTGSPDFRLPAGPFRANWTGQVLLREEGTYRWHAHLHGKLVVHINDRVVLEANAETPQWVSGEGIELSFGELPIAVDYESAGESARLMLAWSSSTFPLEPLPHHALFHERTDVAHPLATTLAVSQHRCTRCHGDIAGLDSPPAPSLVHLGAETSRDWLLDQIQHGGGEHGRMPKFGLSRDDAAAIFAALAVEAQPVEFVDVPAPNEKDLAAGRELLISVGCLACHSWEKQGRGGELSGPPLDAVGKRRTAKWIDHWLRDPAKLNAQHQMPVFALTDPERHQLVSALIAPHPTLAGSQSLKDPPPELVARGNRLIHESRCAACHELPGPKRELAKSPRWTDMKLTEDGCWSAEAPAQSTRSRYGIANGVSLWKFLHSARSRDIQPSADLLGSQLLIQKGCLNCHDRDGRKGISSLAADLESSTPNLNGRAPWLIPPQLTAIGDRLPDERLAKAIRGELPLRRLDWLKVRMPKYQHTETEQTAITAHLIGHDRIPDEAPATPEYPRDGKPTEMTLAGRELLGGKGFSCVACHPVKDYTPKQVALGTRGSNLFGLGDRLRPDYFYRWTRAPLRVMPGVEMPSYQRPHATIFPGDLNRQLAALWTALNDPDLPTPVNPGAVEQYWTVGPHDPPRILRDVITLPGKKEITVPRSFAVGFPSGHNILFDLDTASVRAWTVGDFAQQRTQGKSWFWDLVGTPVMVNVEGESDLLIVAADGKTILYPSEKAEVQLTYSERDGHSAEMNYRIRGLQGSTAEVDISEIWRGYANGWERKLQTMYATNDDVRIYFLKPSRDVAGTSVEIFSPPTLRWSDVPLDGRHGVRIGSDAVTIRYVTGTKSVSAELPTKTVTHADPTEISIVPGFRGKRLPYPSNIMPTAMAFDRQGRLLFTSLKGHVYRANDQEVKLFAEGLAAPFGILASYDSILVAHKPEIVSLSDIDDDGLSDWTTVIATGWGLTDDYHDWTCGLVRDAEGNLFTTLGSDYAQKDRPLAKSKWRGDALKIDPSGKIESVTRGLRFPTGVAMTSEQHVFITDQQGVQNTFNELNWLQAGARYGVPSLHEPVKDAPATPPAVQIPHPWTRSVNGITAIPKSLADRTHPKLFDQLLGCEYDTRFLIRLSWQLVDGVMQGAAYPLCKPSPPGDPQGLLGPLSIAVSPEGDVYVGSIHDSGWQGGLNTGDIVKLTPSGEWPNGLAEIRATPAGFDLEFFHPVDKERAADKSRYQISGSTRVWQGSYATPDSARHAVEIDSANLSGDGKIVSLKLTGLKPGHVYDVAIGEIGAGENRALLPNVGFYTLHKIPR